MKAHPKASHSAEKKRVSRGGKGLRGEEGGEGGRGIIAVGENTAEDGSGSRVTASPIAPSLSISCRIACAVVGNPIPPPLLGTPFLSSDSHLNTSNTSSFRLCPANQAVTPRPSSHHLTSSFHMYKALKRPLQMMMDTGNWMKTCDLWKAFRVGMMEAKE